MRQERTVQATIFDVFAQHGIGCALKAMSQWLDGQPGLVRLVAGDLRGKGCLAGGDCRLKAYCVVPCSSTSVS